MCGDDRDGVVQEADVAVVVQVGVGEEDRLHFQLQKGGEGDIRRDKVGAVDIQPGNQYQVEQVMDPAGGSVLQVLLVEPAVLPEVLAKVQEDAAAPRLDIDLVPAAGCGTVVHRDGCHGEHFSLFFYPNFLHFHFIALLLNIRLIKICNYFLHGNFPDMLIVNPEYLHC